MSRIEIPLFPLRTVLFPGAVLPLRIFEQRYLAMIRDCARNNTGFGVCLIREGEEAVSPVKPAQVGTYAQIVDWYTLEDGLLGVTTIGTDRFRSETVWREAYALGHDYGYRNSQVTVLAPTGTIAFMMDCDTTGVEPELASSTQATVTLTWYATHAVRLEGTYLLSRLSDRPRSRRVFDNHIARRFCVPV